MKESLKQLDEFEWMIPKSARKGMLVDAKVIANKAIMDSMDDETLQQLTNVAMLPGVINPVCAMPDAHFGY